MAFHCPVHILPHVLQQLLRQDMSFLTTGILILPIPGIPENLRPYGKFPDILEPDSEQTASSTSVFWSPLPTEPPSYYCSRQYYNRALYQQAWGTQSCCTWTYSCGYTSRTQSFGPDTYRAVLCSTSKQQQPLGAMTNRMYLDRWLLCLVPQPLKSFRQHSRIFFHLTTPVRLSVYCSYIHTLMSCNGMNFIKGP